VTTQVLAGAFAAANGALGHHFDERRTARLVLVLHQPVDTAVTRSAVALVVATGVAALVGGRRSAPATLAHVNAAPCLLLDAPASLPIRPARLAVERPLWACSVLVLAAPGALVHGPEKFPVVPARIAVESIVAAAYVLEGAFAAADGTLGHHLEVRVLARLVLVLHQPVHSAVA